MNLELRKALTMIKKDEAEELLYIANLIDIRLNRWENSFIRSILDSPHERLTNRQFMHLDIILGKHESMIRKFKRDTYDEDHELNQIFSDDEIIKHVGFA